MYVPLAYALPLLYAISAIFGFRKSENVRLVYNHLKVGKIYVIHLGILSSLLDGLLNDLLSILVVNYIRLRLEGFKKSHYVEITDILNAHTHQLKINDPQKIEAIIDCCPFAHLFPKCHSDKIILSV